VGIIPDTPDIRSAIRSDQDLHEKS